MFFDSIYLYNNEKIIKRFTNCGKYAVIAYNDYNDLYYAIINGTRSKGYKTLGRCKNYVFNKGYHDYLSVNDIMSINRKTFYYNN